jgi:Ca2+-binding EF-hand superfamily protein
MMRRWLYARLLDLHPAAFRDRFAEEMLEIFERERESPRLIGDAALSLARQWTLRGEFRHPAANSAPFGMIEPYRPRPSTLLCGGMAAIAALGMIVAAVNQGRAPRFSMGVHHPGPHLLPVNRESVEGTVLSTTVKLGPDPVDPLRPIAASYFKYIRVLYVLDADQDLIISPWEILTAPGALRRLDRNHDGKLNAEECGFRMGGNWPVDVVLRAQRQFMRENPVLATLDANHDGEISASEIDNSAAALRKLDRNGDGSLEAFELLPDRAAVQAANLIIHLDTNGDGKLSRTEWSEEAAALREFLEGADANHDGVVTRAELERALRLAVERRREMEAALRAARLR